jgi:zinc transport system substrate-binding protein
VRTLAALLGALLVSGPGLGQEGPRPKVGVTLHPLYSWVASVVGKAPVEIVPVIGPAADVHHYQPSPEDLKKLSQLDLLFVNGLGHDDFIKGMVEASGNRRVKIVSPNAGLPLIPYQRGKSHTHGGEEKEAAPRAAVAYNPHTFLTLTGAAQQVYAIEKELSLLAPPWAETFRANARAYARRLRELKAEASASLSRAGVTRVATVHDGYAYLFQEFGIEIVAVIEPAHGVEPSASELAKTIEAIKAARTKVVFSELNFPEKLVDVIRKESGARVYTLDHMSQAESYSADRFEVSMRRNVETLVRALVTDAQGP